jgi:virginiamycin B lyase
MWFVEDDGDAVGVISAALQITEYPLSHDDSEAYGIVVGTDNTLRFTEANANVIARITQDGAISEQPVPTANADVRELAVQRDNGTVWFTEFTGGNAIGQIDVNNNFTEWPLPTANAQPFDIAVDGSTAYFSEKLGNAIGRVTSDGTFTEFAIPTSGSQPARICVGPDGKVWFSEYAGGAIGVLSI